MPSYVQQVMKPEMMIAIGRVAAEWSYFEAMAEMGIWGLASLSSGYNRIITTDMFAPQRMKVLGLLVHKRFGDSPNTIATFNEIYARFEVLNGERNDIIHSDWVKSDDPDRPLGQRFKFKSSGPGHRKRIEFIPIFKDAHEINVTADKIASLGNDLLSLLTAHGVSAPP